MPDHPILWSPSPADLPRTQVAGFAKHLETLGHGPFQSDFERLHAFSCEERDVFWGEWLRYAGVLFEGEPTSTFVPGAELWDGQWFPGVRLNFAENLLASLPETDALIGTDERGRRFAFSKEEVLGTVAGLQALLKAAGVGPGDRVAAVLPNCPETILAMLATTALGGIWSSTSPDFGVQGILDRFTQIAPKFLFTADGTFYNGKEFALEPKNAAVRAALPSLQGHLEIPFVKRGAWVKPARALEFQRLHFSAPLFVMFSSGTTGIPKCIKHGAGGTLLQLLKEHRLHGDLRPGEKILYYTTCGWMMWNWMVAALAVGARVVTFEGSPYRTADDNIWDTVEREQVAVFGTSAKFIASLRANGYQHQARHPLRALRLVLSTGSPLLPEDFDYFYSALVPRPLPVASISGGTDILSCFMLGNPLKPVRRGEIQGRGLGMDVAALNARGERVRDEQGELVCGAPFPSMPIGFWGDTHDQAKYRAAYFERFPGYWHHGDFVTLTAAGGVVMHGRSDATLNPGGVRIGTAEIYRLVETHPAVADTLVVGKIVDGDERIVLFVRLKDGELTPALENELASRIRAGASPRHVPSYFFSVADIPYTVSGKKVELAVKQILEGGTPKNIEALANPASLEVFREVKQKYFS